LIEAAIMNTQREEITRQINAALRGMSAAEITQCQGFYWEKINGVLLAPVPNMIVAQGLNKMLKIALGADAKLSAWYIALWQNATNPLSTWTAANFVASAGEITSTNEGYTGANRPTFSPIVPVSNIIDNVGQEASFNIVCTTSLQIQGAALLSEQARGSNTGVLFSAARYPSVRTLSNGDTYEVGYRVTATSV
jgi:hypothetical protein